MRISVFGLGYVGSVISACMADQGHKVCCFDIDSDKLRKIESGLSPIFEPRLQDLLQKSRIGEKLTTCQTIEECVLNSDISFICVGTPAQADGTIDLSQMIAACRDIGIALRNKEALHTVVIRSTILPGTSEEILIPEIEKASGKQAGFDFHFFVNPEFLREGSAIDDYHNPPKIVIGSLPGIPATVFDSLYAHISCPAILTSIRNAEAIKYVDNAWHALKVSFANEIGNILKEHKIDSHDVMSIFAADRKLNISEAYLKPGFSFGGSCLPKDVLALSSKARKIGLTTPVLTSLMQANEDQITRAMELVKRQNRKKVVLLGLAFKENTDDLRNSPLLKLAEILKIENYDLIIYDPHVSPASLSSHPCAGDIVSEIDFFELEPSTVIIGNRNRHFLDAIQDAPDHMFLIDLIYIDNPSIRQQKNYAGICW